MLLRIGRGHGGGRASGMCAPTVVGPPGGAVDDEHTAQACDAIAQSLEPVARREDGAAAAVVDDPDVEHRRRVAERRPDATALQGRRGRAGVLHDVREQLGDDEVDRARDLGADRRVDGGIDLHAAPAAALPAATRAERGREAAVLQERRRDARRRARAARRAPPWRAPGPRGRAAAAASESPASARRSSAARSSCRRTRRCCGPSWMSRSRRRSAASSACTAAPRAAASARTSAARSSDGQRPSMPRAIAW